MPVVLLSGMGLWGDWETNPSWDAVQKASPTLPDGWEVRKVKLTVSWKRCSEPLDAAWTPDVGAVIGFGMAAKGEKTIRVERVAVNLANPEVRDVDGQLPPSEDVVPLGPAGYFRGLPVHSIHDALKQEGIPARLTAHAGTFTCNYIYYWIMHRITSDGLTIPGGFIHFPRLDEEGAPALDALVRAVAIITETSVACAQTSVGHHITTIRH
jgi:pyroglutamyl-peptidase